MSGCIGKLAPEEIFPGRPDGGDGTDTEVADAFFNAFLDRVHDARVIGYFDEVGALRRGLFLVSVFFHDGVGYEVFTNGKQLFLRQAAFEKVDGDYLNAFDGLDSEVEDIFLQAFRTRVGETFPDRDLNAI